MPGRAIITQKLIDAGADPTITDVLGKTALDYYPLDGDIPHDGVGLLQKKLTARQNNLRLE